MGTNALTHRQTCSENDTSQAVVAGNQYQSAYTIASNEMSLTLEVVLNYLNQLVTHGSFNHSGSFIFYIKAYIFVLQWLKNHFLVHNVTMCTKKKSLTFLVQLLTYLFFGLLKTSITAFLQKYKRFFCNYIFFLNFFFM